MVSIVYYTENVRFLWGKYLTRLKFCDKIIKVNECAYPIYMFCVLAVRV